MVDEEGFEEILPRRKVALVVPVAVRKIRQQRGTVSLHVSLSASLSAAIGLAGKTKVRTAFHDGRGVLRIKPDPTAHFTAFPNGRGIPRNVVRMPIPKGLEPSDKPVAAEYKIVDGALYITLPMEWTRSRPAKEAGPVPNKQATRAVQGGYTAPAGGERPPAPTTGSGVQKNFSSPAAVAARQSSAAASARKVGDLITQREPVPGARKVTSDLMGDPPPDRSALAARKQK